MLEHVIALRQGDLRRETYKGQHPHARTTAAHSKSTHGNIGPSPPECNAVPVRVRDRLRVRVHRPELLRVVRAVVDVQRLGRGTGLDAVGGDTPVAESDLARHAGPEGGEERGAVVRGAVARELRAEARLGRGRLEAEDEGGVCERQTWVSVGEFKSRTVTAI